MKITNPLGFRKQHISVVLHQLAAQENCDGEPFDQMVLAAGYIEELERRVDVLEKLLRLALEVIEDVDTYSQATSHPAYGVILKADFAG